MCSKLLQQTSEPMSVGVSISRSLCGHLLSHSAGYPSSLRYTFIVFVKLVNLVSLQESHTSPGPQKGAITVVQADVASSQGRDKVSIAIFVGASKPHVSKCKCCPCT